MTFNANDWSETSWQDATNKTDSRYADKQKAIHDTIDKMVANQKAHREGVENTLHDDLTELAGPAVYAGFGIEKRSVGGTRSMAYARGYQIWLDSLKEKN